MSREDVIQLLYIVAFSLFIYGLSGLTGPRTAVRGNKIAAVGMGIAVIATFLFPGMGNWGLIALGIAIGTAVGVPAARNVKMTAMPQMVALFNGVGGGAVALIAWVEFRQTGGFADEAAIRIAQTTAIASSPKLMNIWPGAMIGRPGRISWSLPNAMFEPQKETEPMIAANRAGMRA